MEDKKSFAWCSQASRPDSEQSNIFAVTLNPESLCSTYLDNHENEKEEKFWRDSKAELRSILDLKYEYDCETDPLSCTSKSEPQDSESEDEDKAEDKTRKKHPFVCITCNSKFWKRKFYIRHCSKHRKMTNKKDYRDVVASNIIRMTRNSKRTSSMHKDKDKLPLRRIPKSQSRPSPYPEKHVEAPWRSEDRAYHCPYCPYAAMGKKDVNKHTLVHLGDTPYICDLCPCKFNSTRAFKFHISRHHPKFIAKGVMKNGPFRVTSVKEEVRSDNLQKNKNSLQESSVKEGTRRDNVERRRISNRHRIVGHTGSTVSNDLLCCRFSPWKCKSELHSRVENHEKTTKKANPVEENHIVTNRQVTIVYANELTCSYCPLSFTNLRTKITHEWIHTGEMPFTCEFCGASFRMNFKMRKHRIKCRRTPKLEIFSCEYCDAVFKQGIMLARHVKKAHKMRKVHKAPRKTVAVTFSCNLCDASFKIQSMLEVHKRKAHKLQKTTDKKSKKISCKKNEVVNGVQNGSSEQKNAVLVSNKVKQCVQVVENSLRRTESCKTNGRETVRYVKEVDTLLERSCNEPFLNPETLMIKEELIELPGHVIEHDQKLWSEFVVIDDDDE